MGDVFVFGCVWLCLVVLVCVVFVVLLVASVLASMRWLLCGGDVAEEKTTSVISNSVPRRIFPLQTTAQPQAPHFPVFPDKEPSVATNPLNSSAGMILLLRFSDSHVFILKFPLFHWRPLSGCSTVPLCHFHSFFDVFAFCSHFLKASRIPRLPACHSGLIEPVLFCAFLHLASLTLTDFRPSNIVSFASGLLPRRSSSPHCDAFRSNSPFSFEKRAQSPLKSSARVGGVQFLRNETETGRAEK